MVNVKAEPGVGKTRVVQELYRHLATEDPYWPPVLAGLNQRKAVIPVREQWRGEPSFFWLGVSCFPRQDGRLWPALEDCLRHQLLVHARALLFRERRTAAAKRAAIRAATAIGGVIGIEAVNAVLELLGSVSEAREIAQALRAAARGGSDVPAEESVVRAALGVADLINAEGCAMVVVLDDAHDADATTLAAVERLLESSRGVLVVATSWSTAIARQCQEGHGFGAWLARVAETHRVDDRGLELLSVEALADIATAAAQNQQPVPVDREAVLLLGQRAWGNPMLLNSLLELVPANCLMLRAEDMDDLELLPSEPMMIYEQVWTRFLPVEIRKMLEVLAVLGSPIHERMLTAATRVLTDIRPVAMRHSIDEALQLGWLASVPDPYSNDRGIRFTERLFAEVAEGYSAALILRTRDQLVVAAVEEALALPRRASYHARIGAMKHAVQLLEMRVPAQAHPLAVTAFIRLANLVWSRDRPRTVQLLDLAVRTEEEQGAPPNPELLQRSSMARHNLGEIDAALAVCDSALPLMLAIKAYEASQMGRYTDALAAVRDGLEAEIAVPGSVAQVPMSGYSVIVGLADTLGAMSTMLHLPGALDAEVRSLFWAMVKRLVGEDRRSEVSEIMSLASAWNIPEDPDSREPQAFFIVSSGAVR